MRFTTAVWFAIFMRKETARGAFVTVVKQGAQQAGAIFVMHNKLNGTYDLYGPAPQVFLTEGEEADRPFELIFQSTDQQLVDEYMSKQTNFDPDLWLIETESGNGEISLNLVGD